MELGTIADMQRQLGPRLLGRQTPRFNWRVQAILIGLAAGLSFIATVFMLGAGAWNRSSALLMVQRVAPFRTWAVLAMFIAGSALFAEVRNDGFVYRLALVGTCGFFATWTAAFLASWIKGESLSPVGISLCGMISLWSIVLAGVPLTDPIREAAYELVRNVGAPPSSDAPAAPVPPRVAP